MASAKKVILVVEDEGRLAEVLQDALQDEGYSVIVAGDGDMGLTLAAEHHPDLILLDLLLPKIKGLTMLQQLRERNEGKATPVVVLSNLKAPADINEALSLGVTKFLVKSDWDIDDVVKEVKTTFA